MRSSRLLLVPVVLTAALLTAIAPTSAPAAGKITNGQKASTELYQSHLRPLVALVSRDASSEFDGQFCAGTLIDELHVLTAGHCFVEDGLTRSRVAPSAIGVLAGTPALSEGRLVQSRLVPVDSIFVHPFFNIRTMRWDAAVLRLARPITTVPTMPLLSEEASAALGMGVQQATGLVAGWGDMDPELDDCCYPTHVQTVQVPVQTNAVCQQNLRTAQDVRFDGGFQLCAGRLGRGGGLGADTCQGDSGGPLLVDTPDGVRFAGVTSFGVGCGEKHFGVYARATALAGWVNSIPGIPADDARNPAHGPGDLAAPTVTVTPVDFRRVRVTVAPPTAGATPPAYTAWERSGAARSAQDYYLGRHASSTFVLPVSPVRTAAQRVRLVIRGMGTDGEGPATVVSTAPKVDRIKPSVPRIGAMQRVGSGRLAVWRSTDRQSGIAGYWVQQQVRGRWTRQTWVETPRTRLAAGATRVRVRAEDRAGNLSAWSAPRTLAR